jgi:hypothetical protein
MEEKCAEAALRVFTMESDVEFISSYIGVSPTERHIKGEPISARNPGAGVLKESSWIYKSPLNDSRPLSEHIDAVLKVLESPNARLRSLRSKVRAVDLFCMFSSGSGQGSVELDAGLLHRLAKQEVDLIIDLYPPCESAS